MTEKKLSRRAQQRIKRITDSLDSISKLYNLIKLDEVNELVRRSEIPISSSYGGGSFVFARSGTKYHTTSSVEAAVIASMDGRSKRDPLADAVRQLEGFIFDAEVALKKVHSTISLINHPVEKIREKKTSTPCEICLILPVMKTAMCETCYSEWLENGSPDRGRWKAYKLATLNSEGIILVTTPPPPKR
jgi:hypothetical protein